MFDPNFVKNVSKSKESDPLVVENGFLSKNCAGYA